MKFGTALVLSVIFTAGMTAWSQAPSVTSRIGGVAQATLDSDGRLNLAQSSDTPKPAATSSGTVPDAGNGQPSAQPFDVTSSESSKEAETQKDGEPPAVDETALRYFARQGDIERLNKEIARLKTLYPNWQPPADPLEIDANGDSELDNIWKLYSEGRYAEVREAITARQKRNPEWQPPSDLTNLLALAEAREQLLNASDLNQYQTVIRIASENPSLLTCAEVDLLWRVAKAFARSDKTDRAKDAYLYILKQCNEPAERLATMQMASQELPRTDLAPLLATEETGPDGKGEFKSVRADLARNSIAEAADDASVTVSPDDLKLMKRLAETEQKPSDLELLGWYALRRDEFAQALNWFGKARKAGDTETLAQGYALALIRLDRFEEAENVMAAWRTNSDGARAVYLAAAANLLSAKGSDDLKQAVLSRIVETTSKAKDAATAEQLGWYAYGLNQFETAGAWFSTALAWKSDQESAAFGLGLVWDRLGENTKLVGLQDEWAGQSTRIQNIGAAREIRSVSRRQNAAATAPSDRSEPAARTPSQESKTRTARSALEQATLTVERRSAPASLTAFSAIEDDDRAVRSAPLPAQRASAVVQKGASRGRRAAPAASSDTCSGTVNPGSLSAQAALNHGWCLLKLHRNLQAARTFATVAGRGSGQVQQDAAYGESLAYLRLGLADQAAVAATRSSQPLGRRRELDVAILTKQATDAFAAKRPVETLQALDARASMISETNDLLVLRGYAYLKLGRYGDAEQVFSAVSRTGNSEGMRGLMAVRAALQR